GLASEQFPSREKEKNRYLLHNNSANDLGYLDFLKSFIDTAVLPYAIPGCKILDYGSGPKPVLSGMLACLGYECDIYDPIFAKTRLWKSRRYSAVLLHEVAEHLHDPKDSFDCLASLIVPGGIIAIRTRFLPLDAGDLQSWWYRMDPTHVGFFSPRSLALYFEQKGFSTLVCRYPDTIVFRKSAA
ncbi:MAG TPA: class I SAM-dependent methyltransferase, partial [Rectinemataceae bacterium]|nr:class I SAM-dependent methyltransferase [Rectinemataceae bacterium]